MEGRSQHLGNASSTTAFQRRRALFSSKCNWGEIRHLSKCIFVVALFIGKTAFAAAFSAAVTAAGPPKGSTAGQKAALEEASLSTASASFPAEKADEGVRVWRAKTRPWERVRSQTKLSSRIRRLASEAGGWRTQADSALKPFYRGRSRVP